MPRSVLAKCQAYTKMKIKEQLTQDLKQSMIAGEKERRDTIRYLMAQIKNSEIKKQKELEENEILELLLKQSQQRTESIEAFSEANRSDLVDKEKIELKYNEYNLILNNGEYTFTNCPINNY